MSRQALSIAHWVTNLSRPVSSLDDWCAMVEGVLARFAGKKCDILLLPEYVTEQWMSFSPAALKPGDELGWIAGQAEKVIPRLQAAVKRTGVALVAGTMPWRAGKGRITNRAWMLFPDRKAVFHDKLVLIPSEQAKGGWNLATGDAVRTFRWRGFNLAMLICLDIEMPALSNRLADRDIDLLLVPSMTEKPSGYHRVFSCARARAVELMTAVAVVGCIGGSLKKGKRRTQCHGGAAVYVPAEEAFGYTGVFAEIPVHGTVPKKGIGKIMLARDIPVGRIRAVRRGKPEVWPGPWSADKIRMLKA